MFNVPFTRQAQACALVSLPLLASAAFPNKAVKLVVPYSPGGSADIAARLISAEWANAPADGYTIGLQTVSLAVKPTLFVKIPCDTLKDLAPVGMVATSQHLASGT